MIDELNDLEKARILFHWITAQRFDAKAWFLNCSDKVQSFFKKTKFGCFHLSTLKLFKN